MGNIFKEFLKKYGVGSLLAFATLDTYRIQLKSDKANE